MSRLRLLASLVAVSALAAGGLSAAQPASAKPVAVPSSGIGLPHGLNAAGSGVLANARYYDRALKSKLWDPTPDGLVFHSCSYSVPNGSTVDSIRGRITRPNGTVLAVSRCAYPRLVRPNPASAARVRATASAGPISSTSGWLYDFSDVQEPPHPLSEVSGLSAAPSSPAQPSSSVSNFAFTAFQSTGSAIMQPILGWGYIATVKNGVSSPNASGPHPWMAAYYAWGGNSVAATVTSVSPGDTISFSMQASGCDSSGGNCSWFIFMLDENDNAESFFTVVSAPTYYNYSGGVYESYHATNCNQLAGNHHLVWRDLSADVFASPGNSVPYTPDFMVREYTDSDPCSMYATNIGNENGGDIIWTP